jgi:hypothetical protein
LEERALGQSNALDALSGVLTSGASVPALDASGDTVVLDVLRVEDETIEAETRSLEPGDILTARLSDGQMVWFLQLLVLSATESVARLTVAASLPVRSERWMERVPYSATVTVRRSDGREHDAKLCDVSPLGARLVMPEGARMDETLDVRVPTDGADVALWLRVVRVGSDGDVAGEVVALAPDDWVRLERLLVAAG